MPDFTSSLYLGFRNPSHVIGSWESLTTGAPAALAEPDLNKEVAQTLARLQGCERGVLAPSTLHLFWDLFGILGQQQVAIYMDAGVYPIARWGVERAAARGAPVRAFRHHDASDLRRMLEHRPPGRRPVIVTDGLCPACGRPAPVGEYLACARACGGLLVIDDTQTIGILGNSPGPASPYGKGGGGVLRWSGVSGPEILVISSLAKGFGVPVAALSGSDGMIRVYEDRSETRVHCSPPSSASVHAAYRALTVNEHAGDDLRTRLAGLISRFRHRLGQQGLWASGGFFPMQTLHPVPGIDAAALHHQLLQKEIRTVLHSRRSGKAPLLSFIITAGHTRLEIDTTTRILAAITVRRKCSSIQLRRKSNMEGAVC